MKKRILSMVMAVAISAGALSVSLTASADELLLNDTGGALLQETISDIETPAETPADTDTETDTDTATETDTDFPTDTDTEREQGDISGDGKLDISDLVFLRAGILGNRELSAAEAKAADINGDGEIDVMDVVLMRSLIVNGDTIPPEKPITTDTETDTDTEVSPWGDRVPSDYEFLEVDEARIEKAYRAVIEYSITGVHPTAEDLRIVQEDCVKYVLSLNDPIVSTFSFDPTKTCGNSAYYTGVVAGNYGLQGYSVSHGWHWEYETNPEIYASAYPKFRDECRNYVTKGFIICAKSYGWTDEELKGTKFNFGFDIGKATYVVNFLY